MDPTLRMILGILMRWIHVVSIVTLLGAFIYSRLVLFPSIGAISSSAGGDLGPRLASAFRPYLLAAVVGILVSGVYNYLTKTSYPSGYHMWMGIKLLLVLHVLSVAVLYALPGANNAKRSRWATGIVISGLCIILISGYLRWISLNPPTH